MIREVAWSGLPASKREWCIPQMVNVVGLGSKNVIFTFCVADIDDSQGQSDHFPVAWMHYLYSERTMMKFDTGLLQVAEHTKWNNENWWDMDAIAGMRYFVLQFVLCCAESFSGLRWYFCFLKFRYYNINSIKIKRADVMGVRKPQVSTCSW